VAPPRIDKDQLQLHSVCGFWEEPGKHWLSYVVDADGLVVATAVFGPELELLVTVSDGRRRRFPVPEFYRELLEGELSPGPSR
jgi:hypothetical protein